LALARSLWAQNRAQKQARALLCGLWGKSGGIMRSVIFGAIILLFACVFIARAARADVRSGALANCWAYDSDGFNYPQPREEMCFDKPSQAKAAALASCKKHSENPKSCHIVTCGWCGN